MEVLLIDNFDSFTYNLVQTLKYADCHDIKVMSYADLKHGIDIDFNRLLISPGPGLPADYPLLKQIFDKYLGQKPILGICLGHQALAEYFGARLIKMPNPLHGEASEVKITNVNEPIFTNVNSPFRAGRYHSWYVNHIGFPKELKIIAYTENNHILMGFRHKLYNVYGLQFHPESVLTPEGLLILSNWLKL